MQMNTSKTYLSVLMAGMLAAAGVNAQTAPASGSSDLPPKAGEASTQTRGAPNALTTNSTASEAPVSTKDAIRQDASGMGAASATTSVPGKAGEASTMVRGKPNANPDDPNVSKSRAEINTDMAMSRSQMRADRAAQAMGNTRYGAEVGTPATLPSHYPSVFQGGTPQ
jgi:hypothetical protein